MWRRRRDRLLQGGVAGGDATESGAYDSDVLVAIDAHQRPRRRDQLLDHGRRRPDRAGGSRRLPGRGVGRHLRRYLGRQLRSGRLDGAEHAALGDHGGVHSIAPTTAPSPSTTARRTRASRPPSTRRWSRAAGERCGRGEPPGGPRRRGACAPKASTRQDGRKDRGLRPWGGRPDREVGRGRSGRRCRHGAGQPEAEHPRRRPAQRADGRTLDPPASADIQAYAATAGATATLTEGNQTSTDLAYPQIATFSSRDSFLGTVVTPSNPTWSRPGVDPRRQRPRPGTTARAFGFLSGTSESAPQVAGLAALWFGGGATDLVLADEDQVGPDDDRRRSGRRGSRRRRWHRRRDNASQRAVVDARPPPTPAGRPRRRRRSRPSQAEIRNSPAVLQTYPTSSRTCRHAELHRACLMGSSHCTANRNTPAGEIEMRTASLPGYRHLDGWPIGDAHASTYTAPTAGRIQITSMAS